MVISYLTWYQGAKGSERSVVSSTSQPKVLSCKGVLEEYIGLEERGYFKKADFLGFKHIYLVDVSNWLSFRMMSSLQERS